MVSVAPSEAGASESSSATPTSYAIEPTVAFNLEDPSSTASTSTVLPEPSSSGDAVASTSTSSAPSTVSAFTTASTPAPTTPKAEGKSSSKPKTKKPSQPLLPRHLVRDGDNVLLRLPSKTIKPIKVQKNSNVNLGKFGSFKAHELVGRPYGHTFEVVDGKLNIVQATLNEIEESEANNEKIASTGAQKLTFEDIEALKNEGKSGREIIAKQVEEHSAFHLKTDYSKEKYMKRKEAKYLQMFTLVEPTVHEISLYHFEKQAPKTRDLRPDTLSQMMALGNVRPGGRTIVVEDLHGMVVSAGIERMGGDGKLLVINDFDSPPDLHLSEHFNFLPSALDPVISIHWAATDPAYVAPELPMELEPIEEGGQKKNSREAAKLKKRKATFEKSQEAREELFDGGWDSIVIACEYEPYSILEKLLPYIAGSASIVVYSPHLHVLQHAHLLLRNDSSFLAPTITEPWLRKYQVLPGRAHPEMQGMGHGGFLLTATRVFDDGETNSVLTGRRQRKRAKLEEKAKVAVETPVEETDDLDGVDVSMMDEVVY